ncbi:MAG: hypothetical protein J6B54_01740, partial [Clostridia bacterium]|nr:hypothetical protein [Clostridia bacterium]
KRFGKMARQVSFLLTFRRFCGIMVLSKNIAARWFCVIAILSKSTAFCSFCGITVLVEKRGVGL